jgi:hypothetical protein
MKTFATGDKFFGKNHTDMINNALETRLKYTERAGIDLALLNSNNIIAWFVFMDGSTNGYKEWKWKNFILDNGNIIREQYISYDKNKLIHKRISTSLNPYRLAFRLDPFESGNRYFCEFVGAYRLKHILKLDTSIIEYEKVLDMATLNSIGDGYNELHITREDFLKKPSLYQTPIARMAMHNELKERLQKWGFKVASDLLEIQMDLPQPFEEEIAKGLYELFKK